MSGSLITREQRKIVITGFNTDVEHDGVVYHVQTEDKGLKSPLILSLVYVGGTILASKRTPYDDLIATGFDEKKLEERLQRQHKLICAAIHAGRIEDLKRQTERDSASRARPSEPEEPKIEKVEPPQKVEPARKVEIAQVVAAQEDMDIFELGSIADNMPPSAFALPPTPPVESETPPTPPPEEVVEAEPPSSPASNPEFEHVDYSRVVDYSDVASSLHELHISLLDEKKFVAGEFVKIQLHVGRGWDGHRSVANVPVTLKVLGSSFRPLIFSGKTAVDGTAIFYAMLPYFTSGRAAILVSAIDKGDKAELRRVIHQV